MVKKTMGTNLHDDGFISEFKRDGPGARQVKYQRRDIRHPGLWVIKASNTAIATQSSGAIAILTHVGIDVDILAQESLKYVIEACCKLVLSIE